jgi:hypothetical protein
VSRARWSCLCEEVVQTDVVEIEEIDVNRNVGRRAASVSELGLRFADVTLVRPVFDLAADSNPVRGVRVEFLRDDLKPEPHRGVPDLLLTKQCKPSVDVFARHGRLEFLEPKKVLLVEVSKAIDTLFELRESELLLFGGHVESSVPFECRGLRAHSKARFREPPFTSNVREV